MADATLLSEIIVAMFDGIVSASESRIYMFYERFDKSFSEAPTVNRRMDNIFEWILAWRDIHDTVLMKSYNFYSIALAISHQLDPIPVLMTQYNSTGKPGFQSDIVLANLGTLAAVLDESAPTVRFKEFVAACSSGTNRIKQRETRFEHYCAALEPRLI
jgi:hypothetical protein